MGTVGGAHTGDLVYMSSPDVGAAESEAILRALDSGWIAPLGPEVDAFEAELAERCGRKYAVALSSGTAALHLGLLTLGVQPGDYVAASTFTFAATANAIAYVGARPYFVDALPESGNMDPALLDQALADLTERGEHIGAVIPVDLLGKVADYPAIQAVVDKHATQAGYDIPVLSDAAESLGAAHNGSPAGSFGDAAIVSFNGNKVITTSGGGMFLTDNKAAADRVRHLATQARQPVAHYEHTEIGYNYRMSNVLAALGRAQLSRMDQMIARRKEIRQLYTEVFEDVDGVEIFGRTCDGEDNYWLSSIVVDPEVTGWEANQLSAWLKDRNIESRPLWKPMHMQPVFEDAASLQNGVSQHYFEHGITLPSGSALGDSQRERVVAAINEFLGAANV